MSQAPRPTVGQPGGPVEQCPEVAGQAPRALSTNDEKAAAALAAHQLALKPKPQVFEPWPADGSRWLGVKGHPAGMRKVQQ